MGTYMTQVASKSCNLMCDQGCSNAGANRGGIFENPASRTVHFGTRLELDVNLGTNRSRNPQELRPIEKNGRFCHRTTTLPDTRTWR